MVYPADRSEAVTKPVTKCFFHRVVFRAPSAERPTAVFSRRFTRSVGEFDPTSSGNRAGVLALVNRRERLREWNRPESNVLAREIRHLAGRGVPIERIAQALGCEPEHPEPAAPWSILAGPCYAGVAERERF